MFPKTKNSSLRIDDLSGKELQKLSSEPNLVIKNGEIVKVSDEEYAKITEEYEKNSERLEGDTI